MKIEHSKIMITSCRFLGLGVILSKIAVTLESYHLIEIVDINGKNVRDTYAKNL